MEKAGKNQEPVLYYLYKRPLLIRQKNDWKEGEERMKKQVLGLILAMGLCANLAVSASAATLTEVPVAREYTSYSGFLEGLVRVTVNDGSGEKYGCIDTAGNEVIACQWDYIYQFSEGLAVVQQGQMGYNQKYGFIDTAGKMVIPCQYEYADPFSEGLARVCLKGKRGFIDKTGRVVIPLVYDDILGFKEGLARVCLDGKWGFMDKTGQIAITCQYQHVGDFSEDLATVTLGEWPNNRNGYINKVGQMVIPCQFNTAGSFSEGLAAVEINDKWGYIDKSGNPVIPCQYDAASDFSDGVARVKIDGRWSVIDKTGQRLLFDTYATLYEVSNGMMLAQYNDYCEFGYVDVMGQEVIPCLYDDGTYFASGLAGVELNGKWGLIDKNGQAVTPFQYDNAYSLAHGLAVVRKGDKRILLRNEEYENAAVPAKPAETLIAGTAYQSFQSVLVDGRAVEFQCYALKDANGNDTNYVKLRDVASVLNGTDVQFEVSWDGAVNIITGELYTPNGSEMGTPFSGDRSYENATAETRINGETAGLAAILLKDDAGNGYTYYKLRDLGEALRFKVDWSAEKGIFIETK